MLGQRSGIRIFNLAKNILPISWKGEPVGRSYSAPVLVFFQITVLLEIVAWRAGVGIPLCSKREKLANRKPTWSFFTSSLG